MFRLKWLASIASIAALTAIAATAPPAHATPLAPTEAPTGKVEVAPPARGPVVTPAKETVADMRREVLALVSDTSAGADAPVPVGEALTALGQLSDEEVVRLHESLPLIHHWSTIQARMAAGPAAAGARQQTPRGQRTYSPSQASELEAFRADLNEVFVVRQSWEPLIRSDGANYLANIDDGRELLRNATLEDLEDLRDALTWIPDWQAVMAPDLTGMVESLGPGGPVAAAHGHDESLAGAAPQVTTEQCSDADFTRNTLPLIIASAAIKGTAAIEDFVANFFTKDIKVCFAVILVTVCVDFPNPVFFILKTLEFASNRVYDGLEGTILVTNVCQSIAHWRLTVKHRDDFLTNAQGILSSLITRHNELIDRTEQIDFANREAWKLELQLAIEENLLQPLPAPDGSDENRISLFQLTDTACFNPDELLPTPVPVLPTPDLVTPSAQVDPPPDLATLPTPRAPKILADRREQCGIELVKRIVDEAIQLNKLAGTEVHDADNNFAAANVHFAAGRYKAAYLRYRQAYQAAVQPDAEPRPFSETGGR